MVGGEVCGLLKQACSYGQVGHTRVDQSEILTMYSAYEALQTVRNRSTFLLLMQNSHFLCLRMIGQREA